MKNIPADIIRQLFMILFIVLMGGVLFKSLLPYLSGFLGALTLYILLLKPMKKLILRKWRPGLAALFLLVISFFCILLPFAGVGLMLGKKVGKGLNNFEQYIDLIKQKIAVWEEHFGIDLTSSMDTSKMSSSLSEGLQSVLGGSVNMIIAIAMMYFLLYFMLTKNEALNTAFATYSPFKKKYSGLISDEIRQKVSSNAIGIPVVAIAQGIVALIGFLIFGIEQPFFWAVIVTVGSMVPVIGAIIGIIPVFLIALSNDNNFQAWGILLYGIIIVGTTDNVIRVYVLNKLDDVHPLITLIGVIIGVPIFGFIGLIFGPLLISLFFMMVRVYTKEYGSMSSKNEVDL
ncbi:AI-2E family transporter [Maribacter sp. BPC-D8]|uniref:AI-2E family transporter n=1 Tax=Maribacter sp. BPC-D8 TaxID=3053613 RepID=UPI002B47EAF4|nr:AI-2E family transporter [Maribacter sp. BPC-D8]WRI30580.1 AI-2E family transporter [Maribacter sp. BPC-D8]